MHKKYMSLTKAWLVFGMQECYARTINPALCTDLQYFITPSLYAPNNHKVKRGNGAIHISVCLLGKENPWMQKQQLMNELLSLPLFHSLTGYTCCVSGVT